MKKINKLVTILFLVLNLLVLSPALSYAAVIRDSSGTSTSNTSSSSTSTGTQSSPDCTDRSTPGVEKCLKNNPIVHDLNLAVNFFSALFGIVVVGSLIFAGIQYITAGSDTGRVQAAKNRIRDSLIAFVAYIMIVAFLQWLIPGGILN